MNMSFVALHHNHFLPDFRLQNMSHINFSYVYSSCYDSRSTCSGDMRVFSHYWNVNSVPEFKYEARPWVWNSWRFYGILHQVRICCGLL